MDRVIKGVIVVIMLLEVRFFYQILLPGALNLYNYYNNKILICGVMLVGLMFMGINIIKYGYFHKRLFSLLVMGLIIIYALQVLLSSITYDRGIGEIVKESYYFLLVLFYFELTYCCRNKKGYNFFITLITVFTCITSLLFLAQGIVYNTTRHLFLQIFEIIWQDEISMRGGKIRLTQPSTLCCFTIVISASYIIKAMNDPKERKNKLILLLHIANVGIGMGYAIVVAQTRMITIGLILSIFMMFMALKFKNQFKKILSIMLILLIATAFLNSSAANNFFKSFTAKENDGSVYARTQAYEYYMGKIMDNPFIPIGIINQASFPKGYAILHGPQGYLYPSDVGLLGLAVIMGVQSLVWFAAFVISLFKTMLQIRKFDLDAANRTIELIGLLTFLLGTTSTLVVLDCERIMLVPLMLTVFEYNYNECFNKLEDK